MYRVIIGFVMIVLLGKNAFGHDSNCGCKDTLAPPPHYNALYTNKPVIIDGLSDDSSWSKVTWTRWFGDIVSGKTADTLHKTRCKMLWDMHFSALSNGMLHVPGEGTVWRMNFSRVIWPVQVENGEYMRKKKRFRNPTSAHYSDWSPQGQLNLHYPERWGYVTFK